MGSKQSQAYLQKDGKCLNFCLMHLQVEVVQNQVEREGVFDSYLFLVQALYADALEDKDDEGSHQVYQRGLISIWFFWIPHDDDQECDFVKIQNE